MLIFLKKKSIFSPGDAFLFGKSSSSFWEEKTMEENTG